MNSKTVQFHNRYAFYFIICLYIITAYSLYSNIHNTWLITPPHAVILLLTIVALIMGIIGIMDGSSWRAKLRSLLSTIFSILLILCLCIMMFFTGMFTGEKEWIKTVRSPDGQYTVDFYYADAGARGSFGILGELNGPLWFKKRIYYEKRAEVVNIQWENDHTILINNNTLNLKDVEH
ncbi:DUF5412 family protein [Paenibacillus camelliae]|uniref:DUF5412 family protein n=1 Tax=Paenibacillus camelliae TaxID=512410 RepID=UPI00203D977A|nr:DUF5412 family protein [Paenibacillus camelliae]